MKTKKDFYVVAYDIEDDKRRNHIAKELQRYGSRVNLSVFECLLTPAEYKRLKQKISKSVSHEDKVIIYPVCLKCFTKAEYINMEQRIAQTVYLAA